jgi:hypothetical protein
MGFMDLLGKASGASGYGSAFGRSVFDNGVGLGKRLYLGHGTDKSGSPAGAKMFEDTLALHVAGFELGCLDLDKELTADPQTPLKIHCCIASICVASRLGMMCSGFFKKESNKSDFNRAMGAGTGEKLRQAQDGITVELFQSYMAVSVPSGLKFVNKDAPGDGDLVGFYVNEAVKRCATYPIGFQRSGPLGFGNPALALMDDTIKRFEDALATYGW